MKLCATDLDIRRGKYIRFLAAFENRADIADLLLKRNAKVDRFSGAALGKLAKAKNAVDANNIRNCWKSQSD